MSNECLGAWGGKTCSVRVDLGLDDRLLRLSSDIDQQTRMELAKKGQALHDGSYPVPDEDHLKAAAIMCKSKHGDWQAAAKLIARRAKEMGVANPLVPDVGSSHIAATGYRAQRTQRAGLAPDDVLLSLKVESWGSGDMIGLTQEEADNELADILARASAAPGARTLRSSIELSAAYAGRSRAAHPVSLAAREYDDDTLQLSRSREDKRRRAGSDGRGCRERDREADEREPACCALLQGCPCGAAPPRSPRLRRGRDPSAEIEKEIVRAHAGGESQPASSLARCLFSTDLRPRR